MLFGFLTLVPAADPSRDAKLPALRGALIAAWTSLEWNQKVAAHYAGIDEPAFSRQLRKHGPNALRLLALGREIWKRLIKPWCELAGLTREDVLAAFGADQSTEDDLREQIRKQADRQADLQKQLEHQQQQIDELLRLVKPPVVTPAHERLTA